MLLADLQGLTLGEFDIVGLLGRGGMGIVYLAHEIALDRKVAIKVLLPSIVRGKDIVERFRREAKIAASLRHRHITPIFSFKETNKLLFFVMEYVEGTDLKTLIRRRSPMPHPEAVRMMLQICNGVGYAHRAGLVHCDLKPHNILISNSERIKITDFGISRALATISPDEQLEVVWGSPQYFSPEQAAGTAPSPASDVYSLGVILYEMLTGRLPFEATEPEMLAELHQLAPVVPPSTYDPSIPPELDQILAKVLSKEPAARYRTADQLGQVLATFTEGRPSQPLTFQVSQAATRAIDRFRPDQVDWWAIGLSLLAFLAVGGLLPLWLWVWLLYQR